MAGDPKSAYNVVPFRTNGGKDGLGAAEGPNEPPGGGGGGEDMEARVRVLETNIEYIRKGIEKIDASIETIRREIGDIRQTVNDFRQETTKEFGSIKTDIFVIKADMIHLAPKSYVVTAAVATIVAISVVLALLSHLGVLVTVAPK